MPIFGADADELERLATEFENAATELESDAGGLTRTVSNITWLGDVATDFMSEWTGSRVPQINRCTAFLTSSAKALREQARQQREASQANGGTGTGGTPPHGGGGSDPASMRNKTPQQQADWWNSLTPQQRDAYIKDHAQDLIEMDGLPADAHNAALKQWRSEHASEIKTGEYSLDGTLSAGLGKSVFSLDVHRGGTYTTFKDGHVEIRLTQGLGASAGVLLASGSVAANGGETYSFDNAADANKFLAAVAAADAAAMNPITRPLSASAHTAIRALYGSNLISVDGHVSASADGGLGTAQSSVDGGAEYNLRDGTFTISASKSDELNLGGQAETSIEGSVTLSKSGRPLTAEFDMSTASGNAILGGSLPSVALQGQSTTHVSLDLTNPAVRSIAPNVLAAIKRGDTVTALNELKSVVHHAEVTVQKNVYTDIDGSIPTPVISGGASASASTTVDVQIKPAGSDKYYDAH